ncbi:MAG: alpha/beta hydrolase [Actinomycetaceae bacterium]|nr:alpha/beta hydrolase [Actinomycetaceae bacterium]MDY6083208.1 alpha/beta hydrolase [Actinomycetaceae bacterium]
METLHIGGHAPTDVELYRWEPDVPHPRGIIQLIHGMNEHLGRYGAFARFLNDHGYVVAGIDQRGHGLSVNDDAPLGYFGDGVRWRDLVDDIESVRRALRKDYPDLPHVMLGHSMGSFLLRTYLPLYGQSVDAAVFSGTGAWPGVTGDIALHLATALSRTHARDTGTLLNALGFAGYNRGFEHRTQFDWLSRNHENVDAYVADPLCGQTPSNAFFLQVLTGIKMANSDIAFHIPSELPLLFISGEKDPVGGAHTVPAVAQRYRDADVTSVATLIFDDDRHEVLFETDRNDVWAQTLTWIAEH